MKIAIRVDAEERLGTGHFMRCLTLADALQRHGASVTLLSARLPTPLQTAAEAAGHAISTWPDPAWTLPTTENAWGDEKQLADAECTLAKAADADWLVCDHYGLGKAWEQRIRAAGHRVLAIDDLGRAHDCDILLDQNFYARPAERYPAGSADILLIGPKYALLRPVFAKARATLAPRSGVRRLHLCMGGSDPDNATETMLDAVELAGLGELAMDVVIGALHPARASIAKRCEANPVWSLHVQTSRMAELLAQADLAIGAAGTATWERCALGVPTLAVEIASNQSVLLAEVARAGIVHAVQGPFDAPRIARHLAALADSPAYCARMSAAALAVTDGSGADRVANILTREPIRIREASLADSAKLHAWRNAPRVRQVSRNSEPIDHAAHENWLRHTLDSADRWLLIGSRGACEIGVVRFDRVAPAEVEVSIYTTPEARAGDGTALLLAAEAWLRNRVDAPDNIRAVVLEGNARSGSLFARAGYMPVSHAFEKKVRP